MSDNQTVLAVEIGGTKLQMALSAPGQSFVQLRRTQVTPARGAAGILEWLEEEAGALLEQARQETGEPVSAIGVGFGGPIETATGRILVSHQIQGWEGFALRTWLEEHFQIPAVVANDANAAGWAEYCHGAGRGTRQFVYCNIGSGIGGALVLDGKLYDGQGRGACEIGHTYVPNWTVSTPGATDKLENLCSGWAIERRLRHRNASAGATPLHQLFGGDPPGMTCAMLGQAAREGEAWALEELNAIARTVAIALCNVVTLFHPERVALGGGVSLLGDVLLEPLRKHLSGFSFGPYRGRFTLVPCELGEQVVLEGAALLARKQAAGR